MRFRVAPDEQLHLTRSFLLHSFMVPFHSPCLSRPSAYRNLLLVIMQMQPPRQCKRLDAYVQFDTDFESDFELAAEMSSPGSKTQFWLDKRSDWRNKSHPKLKHFTRAPHRGRLLSVSTLNCETYLGSQT